MAIENSAKVIDLGGKTKIANETAAIVQKEASEA